MPARKSKSIHKHDPVRGQRIKDVSIIRGYGIDNGPRRLAEEIGVSWTALYGWFKGGDMELSTFLDLAETLDAPAGYLLGEVSEPLLDAEIDDLRDEQVRAAERRRRGEARSPRRRAGGSG